jgi:hypothetical protein
LGGYGNWGLSPRAGEQGRASLPAQSLFRCGPTKSRLRTASPYRLLALGDDISDTTPRGTCCGRPRGCSICILAAFADSATMCDLISIDTCAPYIPRAEARGFTAHLGNEKACPGGEERSWPGKWAGDLSGFGRKLMSGRGLATAQVGLACGEATGGPLSRSFVLLSLAGATPRAPSTSHRKDCSQCGCPIVGKAQIQVLTNGHLSRLFHLDLKKGSPEKARSPGRPSWAQRVSLTRQASFAVPKQGLSEPSPNRHKTLWG